MNRYRTALTALVLASACSGSHPPPSSTRAPDAALALADGPRMDTRLSLAGDAHLVGDAFADAAPDSVDATIDASGSVPLDADTGNEDSETALPTDASLPPDGVIDGAIDASSASSFDTLATTDTVPPLPDAAPGKIDGNPATRPTRQSVLESMRRANAFFTGLHPDPTADIVTDKVRPSNLWTRAVYYEGLMGLYRVDPDTTRKAAYYDYAVTWGASPGHPWTLTYTAASTMTNNADHMACGQTYLDLYAIDPQPERIAVLKANVDDMVAKGTVTAWTWIDALQMAMPLFARFGVMLSDPAYFDEMWALYSWTRNTRGGGLFNPADGLWWRDWHFTPGGGAKQTMTPALHNAIPSATVDAYLVAPNGNNLYWSRGNGWVMAALARVLDVLPSSDPHHATYVADFRAMADALLPLQRPSGFWPASLADPTHCATLGLMGQDDPETSGTALFAYGLAWGIRNKVLDDAFLPALLSAWTALSVTALQANGLLGYVQSTGDRPCTDLAPLSPTTLANFDDYGVGCFLLAGSELYSLLEP